MGIARVLVAGFLVLLPVAAEAQARSVRGLGGGGLAVAIPQGEFADFVDEGFGLGGHVVYLLDPLGVLGLRLDASAVTYGSERRTVPLSQTISRILVDVTTRNNIAMLGLGPQLTIPLGRVRPYANAAVGLGYFYTESSVRESSRRSRVSRGGFADFARTTNYDDLSFGYGLGGGIGLGLRGGSRPLFLVLDAQYRNHGSTRYLREGSIEEDGTGRIVIHPLESEANLLVVQLGVSVAF